MNSRSGGNPPMRSMNMNTYASQQGARQAPRLQNTQKPGLGANNAGGWAFGPPSSGGGFGGLGGAPGLGPARPGQLSGFAQVMGGGSGQGPIDMSDFPSLGGPQPRAQQSASGWNSSAIRQQQQAPTAPQQAAAPQQPQQRAPSATPLDQFDGSVAQQQPAERGGTGEEFPPLSAQQSGEQVRPTNGFTDSPDQASPQLSGAATQLPIREPSTNMTPGQQAPIGPAQAPSTSPAPSMSQQSQQGQTPMSSYPRGQKLWSDLSEQEKWGMPGLQKTFETIEDHNHGRPFDPTLPSSLQNVWVTVGHDLNSIGVELESTLPLFKTFHAFPDNNSLGTSPFNSKARQVVPTYELPPAYAVNNVPELRTRIQAFSDETLFMIFYQLPRSLEQDLAAAELTHRDWRYHMVVRQWMRQDIRDVNAPSNPPLVDLAKNFPAGSQPIHAPEQRIERGVYIFLNPFNWQRERRDFMLKYDELCGRHLYPGMSFVSPFPASTPHEQAASTTGAGAMRMQGGQVGGLDRQNSVLSGA